MLQRALFPYVASNLKLENSLMSAYYGNSQGSLMINNGYTTDISETCIYIHAINKQNLNWSDYR